MRKFAVGLWIVAFGVVLTSTVLAQRRTDRGQFTAAFYNVENLFDTEDDPATDDNEFLPTGPYAWDQTRYAKKLSNLARVVRALGDNGEGGNSLGLLGLCEVENDRVVRDLIDSAGLGATHKVILIDSRYNRGVDVALVYDSRLFRVRNTHVLPVIPDPAKPTVFSRDVLWVDFELVGASSPKPFTVLVNHWPSRGGSDSTRFQAAGTVRRALDSLWSATPDRAVMLMGDFNDEPHSPSIHDTLGTSTDSLTNNGPQSLGGLWDVLARYSNASLGTHKFQGKWHLLDHFLLSLHLYARGSAAPTSPVSYIEGSAEVFQPDFLKETDPRFAGNPFRTFVGRNDNPRYIGGFADHFPIRLRMSYSLR